MAADIQCYIGINLLVLTAGPSYASNKIRLHGWNPTGTNYDLDNNYASDPANAFQVRLTVVDDPSWPAPGSYAPGATLWTFDLSLNGSSSTPQFTKEFNWTGQQIRLDLVRQPLFLPLTVTDDGATTTNPTRLHATWSVSDPSQVVEYGYAVGLSQDYLVAGWKLAGLATEATENDLSLEVGRTYCWYVMARLLDGTWSLVTESDGITVVSPTSPIVADDAVYSPDATSVHAQWSTLDPWGVAEYQYAIGASPSDLIVDWKSAGTATEATEGGLSLQRDQTYYWYVKLRNEPGLWSEPGSSDGIRIAQNCVIGEARTTYADTAVFLSGCAVTSTATDFAGLWVESTNGTSGVRVPASWLTARGDNLDVAGILTWTDGVPTLAAPELKGQTTGTALPAPFVNNHDLANDRTESLHYVGLNPVGLLATTFGKVTRVDTAAHVVYVDDGAHLADGTGPSYDPFIGLRVAYKAGMTPPAVGKWVRVTGVRTVLKVTLGNDAFVNGVYRFAGETLYLPALTLRDQADILIVR